MFKKIQAKLKNKKGFTLVELLIVIAVLGIIAAIAVPRFAGVLGSVKGSADLRAAELFVKEIEAEFMLEDWAFADGVNTVAKVASKPKEGFDGEIPTAQSSKAKMVAKITKSGDSYTITITDGATAAVELIKDKAISAPIK